MIHNCLNSSGNCFSPSLIANSKKKLTVVCVALAIMSLAGIILACLGGVWRNSIFLIAGGNLAVPSSIAMIFALIILLKPQSTSVLNKKAQKSNDIASKIPQVENKICVTEIERKHALDYLDNILTVSAHTPENFEKICQIFLQYKHMFTLEDKYRIVCFISSLCAWPELLEWLIYNQNYPVYVETETTPLHLAVHQVTDIYDKISIPHAKIIDLLIHAGVDVNAKNKDMQTPLFYAGTDDRVQIAEKLIKAGADINAKDNDGRPVIFYAMPKVARLLLKNGAAFELPYEHKSHTVQRLLILCRRQFQPYEEIEPGSRKKIAYSGLQQQFWESVEKSDWSDCRELLEDGAFGFSLVLPDLPDTEGNTLLHIASKRNNIGALRLILATKAADVTMKNKNGETPLDLAVKGSVVEKALIDWLQHHKSS